MKKIVIEKPGGYRRLKVKEFPMPHPGKGELLIEVHAASVNFADCCVRMGLYRSAKEFIGWPITPGFEVAGIVREIGGGVTQFVPGQRVLAITLFGGYATHLVVPAENVFKVPSRMGFAEAAALPTIFLTAYYGLHELAHVKTGNRILVHSAAGGVGSSLVQLGKLAGCDVMGVVGASHKVKMIERLGIPHVIDKSTEKLWKEVEIWAPDGVDLIFDANGAETLRQSYQHLNRGGKLIVYGFHSMFSKRAYGRPSWIKMIWSYLRTPRFNPLQMTADNHSVMAFNLSYLFDQVELMRSMMQTILKLAEEKKILVPLITLYPFERVWEAHRDLETGQTIGKLILKTDKLTA